MIDQERVRVFQVFSIMNRGGSETNIMNYYRNIDRNLIQFDFIVHSFDKGDFDDEIIKLGGRIFKVPRYKIYNHFEYKKAFDIIFKRNKNIRIIHGHYFTISVIYFLFSKKYGLKCIAHSHLEMLGAKSILLKIITFPLRYIGDYFLACSEQAGKFMFGNKISKSNIFSILNNSINLDNFKFNENNRDFIRNKYKIDDKYIVGHVGRFHPQKNHKFLIEIFREFIKLNPNSHLVLIGEGKEKHRIIKMVENYNMTNFVTFAGVQQNIEFFLSAFDFFLFPSLYEGFGIALLEAEANMLPSLISDTIPKEVIINSNVFKLSLNDTAVFWAESLHKLSIKYKREIIKKNDEFRNYDIHKSAKWLQDFYLFISNM